MKYSNTQKAELQTWNLESDYLRQLKLEREVVRYPKLIDDMGLPLLDLAKKTCLDIGPGPKGILADVDCFYKIALDPLIDGYKEKFKLVDYDKYISGVGEKIPLKDSSVDLVVCTNALDHTEDPEKVISEIRRVLAPSGYLAVVFCTNLALVHPHLAHTNNINETKFHNWIDEDFETIKELTYKKDGYRYGWVKFDGKCGQPAMAWLGRLTTKG